MAWLYLHLSISKEMQPSKDAWEKTLVNCLTVIFAYTWFDGCLSKAFAIQFLINTIPYKLSDSSDSGGISECEKNPCSSQPCSKEQTCVVLDDTNYVCQCRPGYIMCTVK